MWNKSLLSLPHWLVEVVKFLGSGRNVGLVRVKLLSLLSGRPGWAAAEIASARYLAQARNSLCSAWFAEIAPHDSLPKAFSITRKEYGRKPRCFGHDRTGRSVHITQSGLHGIQSVLIS